MNQSYLRGQPVTQTSAQWYFDTVANGIAKGFRGELVGCRASSGSRLLMTGMRNWNSWIDMVSISLSSGASTSYHSHLRPVELICTLHVLITLIQFSEPMARLLKQHGSIIISPRAQWRPRRILLQRSFSSGRAKTSTFFNFKAFIQFWSPSTRPQSLNYHFIWYSQTNIHSSTFVRCDYGYEGNW